MSKAVSGTTNTIKSKANGVFTWVKNKVTRKPAASQPKSTPKTETPAPPKAEPAPKPEPPKKENLVQKAFSWVKKKVTPKTPKPASQPKPAPEAKPKKPGFLKKAAH